MSQDEIFALIRMKVKEKKKKFSTNKWENLQLSFLFADENQDKEIVLSLPSGIERIVQ